MIKWKGYIGYLGQVKYKWEIVFQYVNRIHAIHNK